MVDQRSLELCNLVVEIKILLLVHIKPVDHYPNIVNRILKRVKLSLTFILTLQTPYYSLSVKTYLLLAHHHIRYQLDLFPVRGVTVSTRIYYLFNAIQHLVSLDASDLSTYFVE